MIVRRGVLTDHYVEDERSVVMVDESVLGLSPIATAILEAVPEGADVTLEAVTAHVVDTFGPPDGTDSAEALTEQQVWDLAAHRVLVVIDEEGSGDGHSSFLRHRPGSDASEDDKATAVAALRDALRHLRSDDDQRWMPTEALSSRSLVSAARQHHVVPFLAANTDRLNIPSNTKSELEAAAGRQHAGALVLAADLSVALSVLRDAGVRALAFKGVALSAQAYGNFALRGAGDLDVLVAPKDLERAHGVLSSAGWVPAPAYPRPGPSWSWRHFLRTSNELMFVSPRSDIDLHWDLVPTRSTFPEFDVLWDRHATVTLAGHTVPTLSPYDALAHSAGHAAKDEWHWLRSLLDVHALVTRRATWADADRPLRPDQLLTVGLAAREFGIPQDAPPIVDLAASRVDDSLRKRVHRAQEQTAPHHRALSHPGLLVLRDLRVISRTNAPPREVVRLLSRSALPPWITAELSSPSAAIAAPRALRKRLAEVVSRLSYKRETTSQR